MNDRLPIWKLVSVAKEELLLLGHVAFGWWGRCLLFICRVWGILYDLKVKAHAAEPLLPVQEKKANKSSGIQCSASQQQGFVYSPGKSQWKRSEKNWSWPGADISCSHLSRSTFGASRATGKEEERGCKEREPVTQHQNWLFPHCSLITQSRHFLHQVFIRHFAAPDSHLGSTGGWRCSSDTLNLNVFCLLKLHCVEGVLGSVSEIHVSLWPVLLQVPAETGPIIFSAQHAINTILHIYTEYEVLEMPGTPTAVYPERTAADQHPALKTIVFKCAFDDTHSIKVKEFAASYLYCVQIFQEPRFQFLKVNSGQCY